MLVLHMKHLFNVTITMVLLFLIGCSGGSSTSGEENDLFNWPANIFGQEIDFTVKTFTGGSVQGTINYSYDESGAVVGTNPETGAKYYPDSYSYSFESGVATIRMEYSGGIAYEEYMLTPISCFTGTYSLTSFDGAISGTSEGDYVITSATSCTGTDIGSQPEPEPVTYDNEPNNAQNEATNIPSPTELNGSVNDLSDATDYYELTPYETTEFQMVVSGYGANNLDLYLYDESSNLISSSETTNSFESILEILVVGETYYLVVSASDTAGQSVKYTLQLLDGVAGGGVGSGSNAGINYDGVWMVTPAGTEVNTWHIIDGSNVTRCYMNDNFSTQDVFYGTLSNGIVEFSYNLDVSFYADLTESAMNYVFGSTNNVTVYNMVRPAPLAVPNWCS